MENKPQNLPRLTVTSSVILACATAGLLAEPVFSASKVNTNEKIAEKVAKELTSEEKTAIATPKIPKIIAGCCE